MSAENKALVRRWYEETDRRHANPTELCAPGFTAHLPGFPTMDLAAYEGFVRMMGGALPDFQHAVEDLVAEGDRVATRVTVRGTHKGELMGIPPSGKQVSVVNISELRVAGGKVIEFWASPDNMGLMQQIGAIPAPGQAASA